MRAAGELLDAAQKAHSKVRRALLRAVIAVKGCHSTNIPVATLSRVASNLQGDERTRDSIVIGHTAVLSSADSVS